MQIMPGKFSALCYFPITFPAKLFLSTPLHGSCPRLISLQSIHLRSSLTTSHHSPSKANIHPPSLTASNNQPRPTSHIFLATARLKSCHYAQSLRFCSFMASTHDSDIMLPQTLPLLPMTNLSSQLSESSHKPIHAMSMKFISSIYMTY
jgi:hypothetical protein